MESIVTRANEAAARYLDRRGYEVIERTWASGEEDAPIDIIAKDGDSIVFVSVESREATKAASFPEGRRSLGELEGFAARWFSVHPDEFVGCAFRFDIVALLILSLDRALVRHHINAMGVPQFDPEEE
ncbi:YraN family protein [Adlercreutzia sp. ZJ473]|uniref:YraN family protein n=1 Tax=Adlercreutzia sp. ZJ473 TaxID=2722822 RepID=UPI0015581CD5|nr:YraN family protein [Adlercreutzia sp. ZJ473]